MPAFVPRSGSARVFLSARRTVEACGDARGLRRHLPPKQGSKSGYFHEEVSFRNTDVFDGVEELSPLVRYW